MRQTYTCNSQKRNICLQRAVLVAIAIPVFTAQLHKSKDAADKANARAVYAELQSDFLLNDGDTNKEATDATEYGSYTFNNGTIDVELGVNGYTVTWKCNENSDHNETFAPGSIS